MRVRQPRTGQHDVAGHAGFTLVEMLVAITVAAILLVTIISLLSSGTQMASLSQRHLDVDSEARMVFDRMAEDFAGMIKRPDLDYFFAKATGNDALFFYSEAPALADTATAYPNTCAVIGYRMNTNTQTSFPQLERLGKGLVWGSQPPDGPIFLSYASTALPLSPLTGSTFASLSWTPLVGTQVGTTYTNGTNGDFYHVLSSSVFRMEFCFLLKPLQQADGTFLPAIYSNLPYDTRTPSRGGLTPGNLYGIGPSSIQQIVVTLALLDANNRKIVSAANLQGVAQALPDSNSSDLAGSPPVLMAQTWANVLATTSFPGVPKTASANIRIYQRAFYLGSSLN